MGIQDLQIGDWIRVLDKIIVKNKQTKRGFREAEISPGTTGIIVKTNPLTGRFKLVIDPGPNQFTMEHDIAFHHPQGQIVPVR